MALQLLPPFAPVFVESMRSLGYSLESAIADLIDNSIAAGSRNIQLQFRENSDPYIAILDDGRGMSEDELVAAMRHGAKNPLEKRALTDLGRFGMGLKTASLSQCRNLTVVSLQRLDGKLCSRSWILDLIYKHGDWMLYAPDSPNEILDLPHVKDLLLQGQGTLVIWRELDRITETEIDISHAFQEKMPRVRAHMELTFHRYLKPDDGQPRLRILINGDEINSIDPFLKSNKATQRLPSETIVVQNEPILIQSFVIPHASKLTKDDRAMLQANPNLGQDQGFYIYRNKRLLIHGTWLRLVRPDELTKLARIQIDIPNTLDHLWTIDIRKQQAVAPVEVRNHLRRIVHQIADTSRRVYSYRGRQNTKHEIIHLWNRIDGREGTYYEINRKHPLFEAMQLRIDREVMKQFELLIGAFEQNLPVHDIYQLMANTNQIEFDDALNRTQLQAQIAQIRAAFRFQPDQGEELLSRLHFVEPFSREPDLTKQLIKETFHE